MKLKSCGKLTNTNTRAFKFNITSYALNCMIHHDLNKMNRGVGLRWKNFSHIWDQQFLNLSDDSFDYYIREWRCAWLNIQVINQLCYEFNVIYWHERGCELLLSSNGFGFDFEKEKVVFRQRNRFYLVNLHLRLQREGQRLCRSISVGNMVSWCDEVGFRILWSISRFWL